MEFVAAFMLMFVSAICGAIAKQLGDNFYDEGVLTFSMISLVLMMIAVAMLV